MLARGVLRSIPSAAWKTMTRLRSVPPPFLRVHQMGRLPVAQSLLNLRGTPHARGAITRFDHSASKTRIHGVDCRHRFGSIGPALMMARGHIACDFANSVYIRARVSGLPLHDGRNASRIAHRVQGTLRPFSYMQQRVRFNTHTHARPGQHHCRYSFVI